MFDNLNLLTNQGIHEWVASSGAMCLFFHTSEQLEQHSGRRMYLSVELHRSKESLKEFYDEAKRRPA